MFYETSQNNHDLPHNPFKACIIPRPIGWISSQDSHGNLNLAPYSYFNAVNDQPPMIMFSSLGSYHEDGGPKDSIKNIKETGEFVINIATYQLREAVNISSATLERMQNEFQHANLETIASKLVKPPRVKKSPIHLECLYYSAIELPNNGTQNNEMILGSVIGIHIDEHILTDGMIDIAKLQPIARLGYMDYAIVSEKFSMSRPD